MIQDAKVTTFLYALVRLSDMHANLSQSLAQLTREKGESWRRFIADVNQSGVGHGGRLLLWDNREQTCAYEHKDQASSTLQRHILCWEPPTQPGG